MGGQLGNIDQVVNIEALVVFGLDPFDDAVRKTVGDEQWDGVVVDCIEGELDSSAQQVFGSCNEEEVDSLKTVDDTDSPEGQFDEEVVGCS